MCVLLIGQHTATLHRLKATQYSHGNEAGKLLANQLEIKIAKQQIPYIIHHASGAWLTNPKDIADAFSHYYCSLYYLRTDANIPQPSFTDIQKCLSSISLPNLAPTDLSQLNDPISVSEVCDAIKSLPRGKAPGPDGYLSEYYKLFADTLAPYILRVYHKAITTASFPLDMLEATIVTLPKPGKEPTKAQNFRPISLLNVDVKLYAKFLANRIPVLLPK